MAAAGKITKKLGLEKNNVGEIIKKTGENCNKNSVKRIKKNFNLKNG